MWMARAGDVLHFIRLITKHGDKPFRQGFAELV